jgi:hypothetical protein
MEAIVLARGGLVASHRLFFFARPFVSSCLSDIVSFLWLLKTLMERLLSYLA